MLGLCADVTDETAMWQGCGFCSPIFWWCGHSRLQCWCSRTILTRYGFLCSKCFGKVDEHQFLLSSMDHICCRAYVTFSRTILIILTHTHTYTGTMIAQNIGGSLALQCLESTLESWCKTWTILYRKSCHISSDATVRNRVRKVRYSC